MRLTLKADKSAVLVVPNVKVEMEAEHSNLIWVSVTCYGKALPLPCYLTVIQDDVHEVCSSRDSLHTFVSHLHECLEPTPCVRIAAGELRVLQFVINTQPVMELGDSLPCSHELAENLRKDWYCTGMGKQITCCHITCKATASCVVVWVVATSKATADLKIILK